MNSQLNIFKLEGAIANNKKILSGTNVLENGGIRYFPQFFDDVASSRYFAAFRRDIHWKQESMHLYGKRVNFPRLTAWHGDSAKPYSFSGITLQPEPWTPELVEIRTILEEFSETKFNSVLLNLYRNGNDSISWHSDAEKELGKNPVIGSVNFGSTRIFQLKHIKTSQKIDISLANGSILIMEGELQHFWKHQIPKTDKPVKERINLTFRLLM